MSSRRRQRLGAWLGFWLTAVLIAANYLIEKILHIPLLPYTLFDWMAMNLPGDVVTWGLDRMIDVVQFIGIGRTSEAGKTAERIMAITIVLIAGTGFGAIFGQWIRKRQHAIFAAGLAIVPSVALMFWFDNQEGLKGLNALWVVGFWLVWAVLLEAWLSRIDSLPDAFQTAEEFKTRDSLMTRRIFLNNLSVRLIAVSFGFMAFRWLLNALIIENDLAGIALDQTGEMPPPRDASAEDFQPAPGTRDEIIAPEHFYVIDKNTFPPNVSAEDWELIVDGAVENEMRYSYDDILAMDNAVDFYATLMCISNNVGGDLIDNTIWTGIPLVSLLLAAGVRPDTREIKFYSADGYYESLPLESSLDERSMLCYGMGGESLTVKHGFPLRLYTPGRYGMKNPKWIERIEAIPEIDDGYWTERGWDKHAFINITTIIDSPEGAVQNGMLPVGGIAFGGAKGISKVEVRLENGDWHEATLREALSPLAWVQWRVEIPIGDRDSGVLTARCVDGEGHMQIEARTGSRPDGATGYHQFDLRL